MRIAHTCSVVFAVLLLLVGVPSARGQWNPSQGQWGRADATDLRVMTWNVEDAMCSTAIKSDGLTSWGACARIVALLRPDVLIIQEAGDNEGNGTGSGVDSVSVLQTVCQLFMYGGADPFRGGEVTGFVRLHAPDYDLPHVFVSDLSDGYNRNIILSRYPFQDLNGDGVSRLSDIHNISTRSNSYALGGNGGIRGFAFAEIDLPDHIYAGDLVVGNAHLKAGSTQSDLDQRLRASTNVAYYIDFMFNGAGTGVPDPSNAILDNPRVQTILPPLTAVVFGGDWNEDEQSNGRKGPAEWLTRALQTGGTDGTDQDRTDSTSDASTDPLTGARGTRGGSKLDYLAWFDSIASARRQFVLNTLSMNAPYPVEFAGISQPRNLSTVASDHRPVVVDLILPLTPPCGCDRSQGDLNGDCAVDAADLSVILAQFGQAVPHGTGGDLNGDGTVDAADLSVVLANFGVDCVL